MSYIILARKWRPKTFDEIVGQEFITTTLKNSISSGKLAHAILFAGPRGVGKTSTARILAMSLNCKKGPSEIPCLQCVNCDEIRNGKSLDVIEIDAASHTGVNDIRVLIENVKYLPVSSRTKVYIIDEVHMLSNSAFNALLKTLEEPPEHILFILATTEVNKIPLTILSRCQRYDYKKVAVSEIKNSLKKITEEEHINIDDNSLNLIASEADGSLRDALSLLDQLNITFSGNIVYNQSIELFGLVDKSISMSLFENILDNNPKNCLQIANKLNDKGISPKKVIYELLRLFRYSIYIKACGKDIIGELTEEDCNFLEKKLQDIELPALENIFNLTLKATEDVQRSGFPEIALEMNLVKLAVVEHSIKIDDILEKLESFKTYSQSSDTKKIKPTKNKPIEDPDIKNIKTSDLNKNILTRDRITELVKKNSNMTGIYLDKATDIKLQDSVLYIEYDSQSIFSDNIQKKEHIERIKKTIEDKYPGDINIKVQVNKFSKESNNPILTQGKAAINNILESKSVKDALDTFGGRLIKINKNSNRNSKGGNS